MQHYWRQGAVEFYLEYLSDRQIAHIRELWGNNPEAYEMAVVEYGFHEKAITDMGLQYCHHDLAKYETEIDHEINDEIRKGTVYDNDRHLKKRTISRPKRTTRP